MDPLKAGTLNLKAPTQVANSQPVQMTRAEYEAKYGAIPAQEPVKMTRAEYQAKYGSLPETPQQPKTLGEKLSARGSSIIEAVKKPVSLLDFKGDLNRKVLRTGGAIAGGINDIIGSAVSPVLGAIANTKPVQSFLESKPVQLGMEKAGNLLAPVAKGVETFSNKFPEGAQDVKDIGNILSVLPVGKVASVTGTAGKESVRNMAKQSVESGIEKGLKESLTSTKGVMSKVQLAKQKNVDLHSILSERPLYEGIKVENRRVNPDKAIEVLDTRIDSLLDSKSQMLPEIDRITGKTSKEVIRKKALESVMEDRKGGVMTLDDKELMSAINRQIDELPDELSPSEIDSLRARFRQSARDAKGLQKRDSEYKALENATRDTVFDITENLPMDTGKQFPALNKYVKDMIETKTFLDKTLRGQVVKGGRLSGLFARGVGAIAGSSHGVIGTLVGAELGGAISNILTNNQLGSAIKLRLIKGMTDNPEIIKQAENMLQSVKDYKVPTLPGKGESSYKVPTLYGTSKGKITPNLQEAVDVGNVESGKIVPTKGNPKPIELKRLNAPGKDPILLHLKSSKSSTGVSTSISRKPSERGGVSAQKTDTSGGFVGVSPELKSSIETAQQAIEIQKKTRIPSAQQDKIIYQDGKNLSVIDRDAYEGTKDYTGAILPPPDKIRGPIQAVVKTDGTIEYPKNAISNVSNSIPKELAPLYEEAKKYKSAEEFVKAQGTPVYHSSKTDIKEFKDIPANGSRYYGKGTYFSKDLDRTKEFGDKVIEANMQLKNPYRQGDDYNPTMQKEIIKIFGKKQGQQIIDNKTLLNSTTVNADLLTKIYEKSGYDGVIARNGLDIAIFNPKETIKTKSQLTDIWNKANGTLEQEANKSAEDFVGSLYHGRSNQYPISQMSPQEGGANNFGVYRYFTKDKSFAAQYGEDVIDVKIPKSYKIKEFSSIPEQAEIDNALKNGYDAVSINGGEEVLVKNYQPLLEATKKEFVSRFKNIDDVKAFLRNERVNYLKKIGYTDKLISQKTITESEIFGVAEKYGFDSPKELTDIWKKANEK